MGKGEKIVGAVEMGKSRRLRFPRAVGDGGKLDVELGSPRNARRGFSTGVHRPAYSSGFGILYAAFAVT